MLIKNNKINLGDILVLKDDANDAHYSLKGEDKKYLLVLGYANNNKASIRAYNSLNDFSVNLISSDIESIDEIKHYNIYRLDGTMHINALMHLFTRLFEIDNLTAFFERLNNCYNAFKDKKESFYFGSIDYKYTFSNHDYFNILRVFDYIQADMDSYNIIK